jgi:DNA-nicking Smr family endonuclease
MTETDEENNFFEEMKDVKPLPNAPKADVGKKQVLTPGHEIRRMAAVRAKFLDLNPLVVSEHIDMLGPNDILDFRRPGVQLGVYKKLRLGKYDIEARLDLHRQTVESARLEVFRFVRDCHRYGLRTVIILHGKGDRNPDKVALLKSHLANWLTELDEVMAFHSAQKHHGGTGAAYVLLRKNEQEKQNNRERHGLK